MLLTVRGAPKKNQSDATGHYASSDPCNNPARKVLAQGSPALKCSLNLNFAAQGVYERWARIAV